ncbi:ataxin-7-like protein 2b [Hippoglossus hippoglossus]|uniref:ataxin-7-like protein 2b n=1 Tax=Hippoglossus hippoglossus TaxID=8267 RepID=UPI00148D6FB0|nr:ataxin-7-like protein 2b [Hippoglossus hippoglossus]
MAASSRRHPNLDDCVGLNWSRWADMVDVSPPDAGSNAEDNGNCGRNPSETMTLRKEDMHIYGRCPAHDDFYLVVCSHCGQVVKPGAFEKHCERRHGPLTKMLGQPSTLSPLQRPLPGQPPSNLFHPREKQKDGSLHEDGAPSSAALPVHPHRPSKAQREAASLPSVVKSSLPQHSLPMPRSRVPPCHSGPLPPGLCSSSTSNSERPSEQKSTAGQTSESHTPLRGTRTYSRIYKNVDKKERDLNKHCKILDPERKMLSSRELICNANTTPQQQKAQGRTKVSDQLSVEQRERIPSAGRDMAPLLVKLKDKEQHSEAFEEKLTQGSRHNLGSNCHILGSKDTEEDFPEEEGDRTVEVEPPYALNQSLLSSEGSEDDEQEEATDLPASPCHPKPLGLCTFGCRTLGRSILTFDRRLHHLRFALNTMLEHHVSTHMWKKMPQVSPDLRSCHVTPPAVRATGKPFQSTGSFSLDSTSIGQLENKTTQHNSQGTKPPSSASSVSLGPGRWSNPVGQQSKVQQKEVVLMQDAATRLPQSNKEKSARNVRDPPLHEKGQPRSPSCKGPASSNFSQGKKPCPPLPLQPSERHLSALEKRSALPAKTDRSPRGRGRTSGIQQKAVGFDCNGRGQKRKGSNESPPSSVSKTSKCKRLSSPSRSSLLAWKGENIGDVLAWGLDKTSNS